MPVRASSSHAWLIVKVRDGKPAEAGGLTGADAVLDPGVAAVPDLQELNRAATYRCVGGEDVVTHPVDLVEQRQLRTGVRAFPGADQPGAGRKRGQHARDEVVGELDEFRAVAQAAVAVQRRHPALGGGDRGPDRCGDRDPDGELGVHTVLAQTAKVSEELVCCCPPNRTGQESGCRNGAARGSAAGPGPGR